MSDDYEVGYRKPPRATRFKKGQSGNPKGRPKGQKNMATIMRDVMARRVIVKENGRQWQVPFREAFIHKLVGKTLEGGTRDMIALMKAMHDYMPEALKPNEPPPTIEVVFVDPDGTRWRMGDERPTADRTGGDVHGDTDDNIDTTNRGT